MCGERRQTDSTLLDSYYKAVLFIQLGLAS